MSVQLVGWQDEHWLDHRRRLRNGGLVSLAIHGLVFALLVISPPGATPPLPEVLTVDLVASLPARRPAPRPAPTARAAPEPAPMPAPEPPPPPKPVARAPVQVLPEEAPARIRKVEPTPRPRRRPRQEALSYEAAMAALDEELGPVETSELLEAPDAGAPAEPTAPTEAAEATELATGRPGTLVSRELAAWTEATRRRIQSRWVTPQSFRGRGLATQLELRLSATGEVLGTPRVLRSSGDPQFDDNAVRAVLMVNPLPPPPRPGTTVFLFRSEAN